MKNGFVAVMDIGTNTELILGQRKKNPRRLLPRGRIRRRQNLLRHARFARAIEKVTIDSNGTPHMRTVIGRAALPKAFAASGLCDALKRTASGPDH